MCQGLANYETTFAGLFGSYSMHCPQVHWQNPFNCWWLSVLIDFEGWQAPRTT